MSRWLVITAALSAACGAQDPAEQCRPLPSGRAGTLRIGDVEYGVSLDCVRARVNGGADGVRCRAVAAPGEDAGAYVEYVDLEIVFGRPFAELASGDVFALGREFTVVGVNSPGHFVGGTWRGPLALRISTSGARIVATLDGRACATVAGPTFDAPTTLVASSVAVALP